MCAVGNNSLAPKWAGEEERNKLRTSKRNIILNNYTMSKVIQQDFNINNNNKKKGQSIE
jgi:hypothetical protein